MNCRETEKALQELLDGTISSLPPSVHQHLVECSECRELHQAAQRLNLGLAGLPKPNVPPLLTEKIVAALQKECTQTPKPDFRFRRTIVAFAMAAAVLLVVVGTLFFTNFRPTNPAADLTVENSSSPRAPESPRANPIPKANDKKKPEQPNQTPEDELTPEELRAKVAKAGSAVAKLRDRFTKQTQEQAQVLWKATQPEKIPKLTFVVQVDPGPDAINPTSKTIQQAGAGVTTGVRTVTNSAQRAVSYFSRALPVPRPQKSIQ